MAITDNRTQLNDCQDDTQTFSTTGAQLGTNTLAGNTILTPNSVETQHSNVYDDTYTTGDSAGSTFNLGTAGADMTIYVNVKDNGVDTASVSGASIVLGDGTDRIGYTAGGSDALGLPYQKIFYGWKIDTSDCAANPGTADVDHHVFAGTEANLNFSAITTVGYGSLHNAKAQGNVVNTFISGIYYIANDSYAVTINGGTAATPETMTDVVGDDETLGAAMFSNPIGSAYYFNGPTEWGNSAATAEHAFTATGEQWFWLGDNGGGRSIGATHLPMRVIGNATDTGTFKMTQVSVVNTGTGADFDMSSTNVNTLEIDLCLFDGLSTIDAPASGGTSRFCTNTTFTNCGQVTSNLCDMSGNSYLTPTVAADGAALSWDETISGSKVLSFMDDSTFTMGTNNHHAISFSANVSNGADITLTNHAFDGFDADGVGDSDNSILEFLATTGTITVNLIGCTVDGANASSSNFTIDTRAGCTVNATFDPKTTKLTVETAAGVAIENARVLMETADNGGGSGLPYQDSISITQTGGTATVTHTSHGLATNDYVVIRGATQEGYNKQAQITVTGTNTYTYTVDSGTASPATGSPVSSYAPLSGLTDSNGVIQSSKTWPASQGIKGWARKSTNEPFYKETRVSIADASGGTDLTIALQPDD